MRVDYIRRKLLFVCAISVIAVLNSVNYSLRITLNITKTLYINVKYNETTIT